MARGSGLSLSHARLAKLREDHEPFELVNPSPDARRRLWRALRAAGLGRTAQQGVYEHVGAPASKGYGISVLTRLYRRAIPTCLTVGLGSGPNSTTLLNGVDIPFMTDRSVAGVSAGRLARFPRIALTMNRSGWLEATLELARQARQRRPTVNGRCNNTMDPLGSGLELVALNQEIIVVSNREPCIHDVTTSGDVVVRRPASGLVTALEPVVQQSGGVWVAHGSGFRRSHYGRPVRTPDG